MQQVTTPSEPLQIRVGDGLSRHGEPPWAEQLLSDGRNLAVLICNSPGQTNDAHVGVQSSLDASKYRSKVIAKVFKYGA